MATETRQKQAKKCVCALLAGGILISGISFPNVAQASTVEEQGLIEYEFTKNSGQMELAEPIIPMVRSNQTESGGSSYKYISSTIVNLNSTGVNTLYQALLAGGLAKVSFGGVVAKAMVGTILSNSFKNYNYMKQTIYKKSDKNYYYYKVIDEFSNSKTKWKGPVNTSYQKVRK
ncbi:hypothetical protein ACP0AK_05550 [Listeria ivanovii]|uniref:DUF4879 domain-containing protein n=2 Tax=Listeria ivanovii TaxID=1638 RepID=G2ZCK1_LISIP|nr:hypothetical protein [Listeria ivanovii]AHI55183.1 hypothetical protein AX25_03370 [Listeria ivanovii WSLC3009]MBC1758668.1 hypothetical protein [Listeria ivanovii]MBK3913542.1 hypothetical protein [Listeria ivanovii subsp. ivanovii]MBK3920340.1 hypothetical protein [Listeria ivanovii subsp. ivanovii]MBK3925832.1 hypothetical protein [Listeria ivanovii subsp. ivanovii]